MVINIRKSYSGEIVQRQRKWCDTAWGSCWDVFACVLCIDPLTYSFQTWEVNEFLLLEIVPILSNCSWKHYQMAMTMIYKVIMVETQISLKTEVLRYCFGYIDRPPSHISNIIEDLVALLHYLLFLPYFPLHLFLSFTVLLPKLWDPGWSRYLPLYYITFLYPDIFMSHRSVSSFFVCLSFSGYITQHDIFQFHPWVQQFSWYHDLL